MSWRGFSFANKGVYHVFTKTIDNKQIFNRSSYINLFLDIFSYYRSEAITVGYSDLKKLPIEIRVNIEKKITFPETFHLNVITYSIMPTHFHFQVIQYKDNGVIETITKTLNSFTRIYNLQNERKGQLFLKPFKAVEITSDEQLIHVSRYIHLNIYSAGKVTTYEELLSYPWSSLSCYISSSNNKNGLITDTSLLLNFFNNDRLRYKKFILNNAEYQKSLERFKYARRWEF